MAIKSEVWDQLGDYELSRGGKKTRMYALSQDFLFVGIYLPGWKDNFNLKSPSPSLGGGGKVFSPR